VDALLSSLGLGSGSSLWELSFWLTPIKVLLASFVFGQLLAWTYEYTYRGLSYSRGFSHTIVLTTMSAVVLVLAMERSLIAGLGLVGVLSMTRFRNNLKAPRDLVFLMGAATIGLACGVTAVAVGALGTGAFCAAALYLNAGAFGSRARYDGVLRFRVSANKDLNEPLQAILERHCRRCDQLSVGEIAQGSLLEYAYQIKLWDQESRQRLIDALRRDLGVENVRLLLQDATLEY
jgi:hypothetical protein